MGTRTSGSESGPGKRTDPKGRQRAPVRPLHPRLATTLPRALLIRYDKNPTNYLGLIQLASGLLWYRRRHRLLHA